MPQPAFDQVWLPVQKANRLSTKLVKSAVGLMSESLDSTRHKVLIHKS